MALDCVCRRRPAVPETIEPCVGVTGDVAEELAELESRLVALRNRPTEVALVLLDKSAGTISSEQLLPQAALARELLSAAIASLKALEFEPRGIYVGPGYVAAARNTPGGIGRTITALRARGLNVRLSTNSIVAEVFAKHGLRPYYDLPFVSLLAEAQNRSEVMAAIGPLPPHAFQLGRISSLETRARYLGADLRFPSSSYWLEAQEYRAAEDKVTDGLGAHVRHQRIAAESWADALPPRHYLSDFIYSGVDPDWPTCENLAAKLTESSLPPPRYVQSVSLFLRDHAAVPLRLACIAYGFLDAQGRDIPEARAIVQRRTCQVEPDRVALGLCRVLNSIVKLRAGAGVQPIDLQKIATA